MSKKRKYPDAGLDHDRQPSPLDRQLLQESRTPSVSRSSSVSSNAVPTSTAIDVYNGLMETTEEGFLFCRPVSIPRLNTCTHAD
jgi:histone-lysine N-methyltransferase SUV39H